VQQLTVVSACLKLFDFIAGIPTEFLEENRPGIVAGKAGYRISGAGTVYIFDTLAEDGKTEACA